MKTKLVLLIAVVSALIGLVATTVPVEACEPLADDVSPEASRCLPRGRVASVPTPTPAAWVAAAIAPAPTPIRGGTSPADAFDIPNDWRTLAPGAAAWYRTTNNDSYRVLELRLETNPPNLAGLAIYSPDQMAGAYSMDKPVGRGTPNKALPENVLYWKAGYARPGAWYALVTNNTHTTIAYKLSHNQQDTATKNCFGYWEFLPNGAYVYWIDCSGRTSP